MAGQWHADRVYRVTLKMGHSRLQTVVNAKGPYMQQLVGFVLKDQGNWAVIILAW